MTGTPDLLHSDVEDDLRSAVRELLADHCRPQEVLAGLESPGGQDARLYRRLAELGLAGLGIPEACGGQGGSARELAVVMEELGRAVAPVPFLGSVTVAAVLAACGAAGPLERIAAGEVAAAPVVPLTTAPGTAFPQAVRVAPDGTLSGRVTSVAGVTADGLLLVPAAGPGGAELLVVAAGAAGVRVEPVVSLDLTRPVADVVFEGAAGERVAGPGTAADALAAGLLTAAGLLASEQLGLAEWCLTTTVEYLRQRRQFGRIVGSFQAVKHRLADLWQEVVTARAVARAAADALASGSPDAATAVAVAQAYCSGVAVHAAEECVQLHGGIGMTWEHPAHLYLKRAKADELALGTPARHRRSLAALVELPPPDGESP